MADEAETEAVVRTAPLPGGVYRVAPEPVIPERGTVGYIRDKVIGAAQGAIDIGSSLAAVQRDISYDPDYRVAAQAVQEGASDTKRWLSDLKTPYGQAQEEGKVPADTSVIGTVLDAAPAALAVLASGPLAPLTGGAIAHGVLSNEQWDILRRMPEEELRKNEKYVAYRDKGMDHLDAIREIYKDRNTLESLITNVGSNMLMAGIGQRLMTGVGSALLRTDAGNMAARIIKNATMGTVEGGVAGAALGGGTEWGRQAAEIGMGLRKERDWSRISEAVIPTTENLAILGGITGGVRGFAQPRPPGVVKKVLGKAGEIADDVGYTPSADEIGTDLRIVTGIELSGARPSAPGRAPLEARPTTEARPAPEVRPPGAEVQPPAEARPARAPGEVRTIQEENMDRINGIRASRGEPPLPPEHFGVGVPSTGEVTRPGTPAETTSAGGGLRFRDYDAIVDALTDTENQLRSMDAAGPEQKATPEWIQGHHELLEHHENLRAEQRRLAASRSEEGAGEDTVPGPTVGGVEVPGPTPPTPTPAPAPTRTAAVKAAVAKAAEKTTKVADDAAGAAVPPGEAANEFTVDELKARAADVERTPDMGALEKHIAEWRRMNPGQKLSDLNVIRATAKAAIEAERQKVTNQERLDQQRLIADRKLRNRDKKGEAAQRAIAKKQAAGYARAAVARERVEAAKKKGKPKEQEVTQPGESEEEVKPTEAETPKPVDEVPTIGHNAPPEEVANVNTLRAKLGLKPVGAGVTHGSAATEAVVAAHHERQGRLREAEGTVVKGLRKAEDTGRDTEGAANRRDPRYSERETLAKETMKQHQPQGNYINHLEEVTDLIKKGDPTDDTVKKAVAGLVEDAKKVFDEYKGEVDKRSSGPKDVIWNIARGGGKSRATKKGDYHAFMSDLNNFVIDTNEAIKKSEDKGLTKKQQAAAATKAKELALKHLDDSKLVREGDMETLVGQRGEKNAAVSMVKRTFSNQKGELDRLSKDQLDRLSPKTGRATTRR